MRRLSLMQLCKIVSEQREINVKKSCKNGLPCKCTCYAGSNFSGDHYVDIND